MGEVALFSRSDTQARTPFATGLVLALGLTACGGSATTPSQGNAAPAFTSAATASIAENTTATAYQAAASDANGDALSFAIAGGADAARLRITAAGALSFVSPPDFEAPADANADNRYAVDISVTDGQATTTLSLQISVTDAAGSGFAVRRVGTGFAGPIFLAAFPDNAGRVLVVERAGKIRMLNPATGAVSATPFLDITGEVATDGERALYALALAPDYMSSGNAYVFLAALDGAIELRRYRSTAANRESLDRTSGDLLLRIDHPRTNHYGGWIAFGADGLLYMATGDGGGGNDPDLNGQNRSSLLGKLLRLDVASDGFPADASRDYAIPSGNPFRNTGGAPEVLHFGLRNPFRNSFDRATGQLWIADVGQGAIEEINRLDATSNGLNLGWPLFEGTRPNLGSDPAGITMPLAQYAHGSGPLEGRSVTGGYVYRGPVEALQGLYIFADFISNNIWSVPLSGLPGGATASSGSFTNRNAAFTPDAGSLQSISSFGEDQAGNLYLVSILGSVFRIEPVN